MYVCQTEVASGCHTNISETFIKHLQCASFIRRAIYSISVDLHVHTRLFQIASAHVQLIRYFLFAYQDAWID